MHALIVEDDKDLAAIIAHVLQREGIETDVVFDGEEGLAYAEGGEYDVIILDVMLPKMNGFDVAKQLRESDRSTPILMLTALGQIQNRIDGLDSGADHYMTKPFAPGELSARIRALTRRKSTEDIPETTAGDLSLDEKARTLACGDEFIQLSNKEYLLAKLFLENPDRVLTRAQMINTAWDDNTIVEDNSIEAYVSMLRKKLKFLKSQAQIKSERSLGYKLITANS